MRLILFLHLVILALACDTSKSTTTTRTTDATTIAKGTAYICIGNEPNWRADISESEISFLEMGAEKKVYPYRPPAKQEGVITYRTKSASGGKNSTLNISITESGCVSAMSGEKFPYSVVVQLDGQEFKGCAK